MEENKKTVFEEVAEAEVPYLRDLAADSKNPLYVWDAIRLLVAAQAIKGGTGDVPEEVAFPKWIADYLVRVACSLNGLEQGVFHQWLGCSSPLILPASTSSVLDEELSEASAVEEEESSLGILNEEEKDLTPAEAVSLLPKALGMTRTGWNAFSNHRSTTGRVVVAGLYEDLRKKGLSAEEASSEVRAIFAIPSDRQARRDIKEGRRFPRNRRT